MSGPEARSSRANSLAAAGGRVFKAHREAGVKFGMPVEYASYRLSSAELRELSAWFLTPAEATRCFCSMRSGRALERLLEAEVASRPADEPAPVDAPEPVRIDASQQDPLAIG